jgi:hypothetical protein
VQTVVGLVCVVLGCLHFADRDRRSHQRSFYLGAVRTSPGLRGALALVEVVCGLVLLFTA